MQINDRYFDIYIIQLNNVEINRFYHNHYIKTKK